MGEQWQRDRWENGEILRNQLLLGRFICLFWIQSQFGINSKGRKIREEMRIVLETHKVHRKSEKNCHLCRRRWLLLLLLSLVMGPKAFGSGENEIQFRVPLFLLFAVKWLFEEVAGGWEVVVLVGGGLLCWLCGDSWSGEIGRMTSVN